MPDNYHIEQFGKLASTNAKAKELAAAGAETWMAVAAKIQTNGYGRKGDGWYSPEGGLYFSVILPKSNIDDLQILTILAAFAAAKTIKDNFGVEPFVKLPNDVYLNGKKICGILTENIIAGGVKSSVIGIGVNTDIQKFPEELSEKATSLKLEIKGASIDNNKILCQIITQLQGFLKSISR